MSQIILWRKQAEEEKEKLQARVQQSQKIESIGTLAGGIAHDFNNILGIILGNTELASDILPEKEPALLNLKEIRKACLRAKDIVKQLLSFARKTDPKRHPIKLIAVVDDEASNIYVGRNRLERLGYQVETRMSPLEALELFQADPHQFDLLITDMSMPQMTGDRLVKEILKLRPDMPTILCSGFNEKMDEERAAEIGIRQYIEKNYDKRFMAKIVRDVLDGK